MPTSVTMPALGESVTEGTVTRWLKQEGERVETDEPLLEVSTDKVDTEIPSPAAGVLTKILVAEDETVEVGAELALIGGDGEGGAPTDTAAPQAPPAEQVQEEPPAPAQEDAQPEPATAAASDGSGGGGSAGGGEGTPVTMPALGESVTEGTVTRWLKSVGDEVTADEPLLEVSTDKVDTEIPAPVSGTLLSISVNEDETVDVGAELAVIGSGAAGGAPAQAPAPSAPAQQEPQSQQEPREAAPPAQATQPTPQADPTPQRAQPSAEAPGADYGSGGVLPSTSPTDAPSPAQAVAPQAPAAPETPAPAPAGDGGGQYVTPLVRRLAAEHGVDLSSVTGTGVGGRIRKQDVLAAAEKAAAPAEAPAPAAASGRPAPSPSPAAQPDTSLRGRTEKLSRLRTVIARRMVESLAVSAQLTTVVEADVTAIARLRDRAKRDFETREGVKLSFLPFFAKAAVEALKAHPAVNSSIV